MSKQVGLGAAVDRLCADRKDVRVDELDILRRYLEIVQSVYRHVVKKNPRILTELRRSAKLRREKALK